MRRRVGKLLLLATIVAQTWLSMHLADRNIELEQENQYMRFVLGWGK